MMFSKMVDFSLDSGRWNWLDENQEGWLVRNNGRCLDL